MTEIKPAKKRPPRITSTLPKEQQKLKGKGMRQGGYVTTIAGRKWAVLIDGKKGEATFLVARSTRQYIQEHRRLEAGMMEIVGPHEFFKRLGADHFIIY